MKYMPKKREKNEINWNNDFVRLICSLVDFIQDVGRLLEKEEKEGKKKK